MSHDNLPLVKGIHDERLFIDCNNYNIEKLTLNILQDCRNGQWHSRPKDS